MTSVRFSPGLLILKILKGLLDAVAKHHEPLVQVLTPSPPAVSPAIGAPPRNTAPSVKPPTTLGSFKTHRRLPSPAELSTAVPKSPKPSMPQQKPCFWSELVATQGRGV